MQQRFCHLVVFLFLCGAFSTTFAQDAPVTDDATTAIRAAIQSYVASFNARDVEGLVAHWSPAGVYISRNSGDQIVGREAMTKEFTDLFAGEQAPQLAVASESIELISPNVALERGTATTTHGQDTVVESTYSVVYVKHGEKWLIDRVTEDEIVVEPSNYEHLKELEWLIGEWSDVGDGFSIEFNCQWTKNQNYISRTYKVSGEDGVESSGLQIIGWDPREERIRSWLFDSSGGFVSGTWTNRNERWVIQSVATLADGGSGSYSAVIRPLEDGNYGWQKINQVLDGELLPNTDEVLVQRINN